MRTSLDVAVPAHTLEDLPKGTHAALIYDSLDEQLAAVIAFVRGGLARRELCLYIADDRRPDEITSALVNAEVDVPGATASGALALLTKQETYLRSGAFDPDQMLQFLIDGVARALAAGYTGLCVAGEMSWALGPERGCDRLIDYEGRVSLLLPTLPAVALCQYSRSRFPASVINGVIRTHPIVVVGAELFDHNPYYDLADSIAGSRSDEERVKAMVAHLRGVRGIDEARRESARLRNQLSAIVESSHDAIYGRAADGTITSWNAAAQRLFGYSADEIVGRSGDVLVLAGQTAESVDAVARTLAGEEVIHFDTVRRRKDGTLVDVSLAVSPVYDEERALAGLSTSARDVTERHQVEAALREASRALRSTEHELRRLNEELEARVASRTEALAAANRELDAFTYSVSHDLQSPLRALRGFAKILLDEHAADLPDEARHYVARLDESARRMARLVDDALRFSRMSRLPLTLMPVDMTALVHECYGALAADRAGRNIDFRVAPLPACTGDLALLRQVVINLLSNAIKFTGKRAAATIEVGEAPALAQAGERVYFARDNGAGFDMQYAGKLFGIFQRLHSVEEFEGTGAGLATVHRIIQRHGGRVWAEAAVEQGATFYVALPAAVAGTAP